MKKSLKKRLEYYLLESYHRKILDRCLGDHSKKFKGKVLDIGGGKRDGDFKVPDVQEWVVVDIDKSSRPDIVASVTKLPFKSSSFGAIKATELFEHVEDYEKGVKECVRVLKKGGYLIISTPFMGPIHGDPNDFQRFTDQKWCSILKRNKITQVEIIPMGFFFTTILDTIRTNIKHNRVMPVRFILYLLFPLMDLLCLLDNTNWVKNSRYLNKYIGGFFVVARR